VYGPPHNAKRGR